MSTLNTTVRAAIDRLARGLEGRAADDPATWAGLWRDRTPHHLAPRPPRAIPDRPEDGITALAAGNATWRPSPTEPATAWLQLARRAGKPRIIGRALDERGRAVTVPLQLSAGITEWASHIPEPQG